MHRTGAQTALDDLAELQREVGETGGVAATLIAAARGVAAEGGKLEAEVSRLVEDARGLRAVARGFSRDAAGLVLRGRLR